MLPLTVDNVEAFKKQQGLEKPSTHSTASKGEYEAGGAGDPYNHKQAIMIKFINDSSKYLTTFKSQSGTGSSVINLVSKAMIIELVIYDMIF